MKRDHRQGVYIWLPTIYVGSVAGGTGRSFDRRQAEHLKLLEQGRHHNDKLQRRYALDGGKGWRQIRIALPRGQVELARRVEKAVIRALGKGCCNERK